MKQRIARIASAMVLSWSCRSEAATIVDFTGPYAPDKWSTYIGQAAYFSHTPFELSINHASLFSDIFVTVVETGTISFDWSIEKLGGVGYIAGGVKLDQSLPSLQIATYGSVVTEHETISVVAGQKITFSLNAERNGDGYLKITNFRAEGVVPEPSVAVFVSIGLAGLAGLRRHGRVSANNQNECA